MADGASVPLVLVTTRVPVPAASKASNLDSEKSLGVVKLVSGAH